MCEPKFPLNKGDIIHEIFQLFKMGGSVDRIWTQYYVVCYYDKLLFVLKVKLLRNYEC